MKKGLLYAFLLLFLLLIQLNAYAYDVFEPYTLSPTEVIFTESTYKYDVIDPQVNTNRVGASYPGLRGANQLVVYTPEFGFRTNTNEFGTEAVVTGDTVSSLSGADSIIPFDGVVISGHGRAKKWINEYIMVGSKVSIDKTNKTITSYITSETFLYGARKKVKEVQEMMSYYTQKEEGYNRKKTEQNILKANEYILKAEKDCDSSQKYASKAIELADYAMSAAIPYNSSEMKGIWIRPTYHSIDDIIAVLDRLAKAGIDNVFIETFYHGQTIYPSKIMEKYGFVKQNPDYIDFDPLKVWITEAHKRGIKVHIWFETFYVGNKHPNSNPKYILAQKPEWANYQKKNAGSSTIPYSVSEHNGYFLDPANSEVQNFLCDLLEEIILRYRPDGINLDYVRYPQALAPNFPNYDKSNWGYTKFARSEFIRIYGVDPMYIRPSEPAWFEWKNYRCDKITKFVQRVNDLCKPNNITLTAVIFPNRVMALDTKMQDWKTWSQLEIVDGFTPLFLTCDYQTAMNLMGNVARNKNPNTKLYGGLFVTFMKGSNADLIKQIHAARKCCLDGLIIFDYAHMDDYYVNALTESVFKPIDTERNTRRGRRQ